MAPDLFLVDAPLELKGCAKSKDFRAQTSLRFRIAGNRGGLLLPQLFAQPEYSLLEIFKSVFRHSWHFEYLLPYANGAIPPHALLYMLVSSTWESNLRFLDARIKSISFRDLRDPKDSTNGDLHDCREDLDALRTAIIETLNWVPVNLFEYYDLWPKFCPLSSMRHPIRNLERILKDADILQSFLMDTFQLLMSSISVRDSKLSIEQAQLSNEQALLSAEQAKRSAWLTQLATLYLPLSVLTGIFGMNLKEINDAHVPFWWSLVVFAILLVCTGVAFFGLRASERRTQRNDALTVGSVEPKRRIAGALKSAV
ncbi:hypothetical protein EJ04DRAFT_565134 [Polyplosphaeria fusca]|uniref:Mg2+ transporter protein n=1 Tax=Polyplosphaeria fusca TaxID=682080 RepID=A0A9P4QTG1_9PLEO|nr:hypothetical protein EJ04DRAFT_565134 [Polyplosphaeria fusca]